MQEKKKKRFRPVLVAAIALLIALAAASLLFFLRVRRLEVQIGQQNYVSSRLIEMGDYEQARVLAAQTDQIRNNITSRQLLVLSSGFQGDYDSGIRYADEYLEQQEDGTIGQARKVMTDFLAEEEKLDDGDSYYDECEKLKDGVRESLMGLLVQVQGTIEVDKSSESILAMLDMMSSEGGGLTEEAIEELEKDNSPLSLKIQTAYAIQTGDYGRAFETAKKSFDENDSFENRTMLANLVAKNGYAIGGEGEAMSGLREEQDDLYQQLGSLESQYAQASASEQQRLDRQIENLNAQIKECEAKIDAEPAKRAINFIETTTPVAERTTVSYRLELAQLYYQAMDRDRAKELLVDVIKEEDGNHDPASMLMDDFIEVYRMMNGQRERPEYLDEQLSDVSLIWNRIAQVLNFVDSGQQYAEEESFYGYVLSVLDELYNGIIIRGIDASDFPTVRVTVNVAMELESQLAKEDFSLLEMNEPVEAFELLPQGEQGDGGALSVVLVVDRSGSMDGQPMEDTKKAVSNFIKNMDDGVEASLVTFDDMAYLECGLTGSQNEILQAVRKVAGGGGTNIYSGLEKAGEILKSVSGRKIVILLSDGEDGNPDAIDTVLDVLNRENIYVYTVGFGGVDTEYLSYIATYCHGKFIQADSSKMLGEIYAEIGDYMTNDYVLQFDASTLPEELDRTLNVSVDVNDAFAEKEYSVGVPYEDIKEEADMGPEADYFNEIGGSMMDGR